LATRPVMPVFVSSGFLGYISLLPFSPAGWPKR
jgi:hypothetical protein